MTTASPTIDVRAISKWYGNVVAVNEVSFQVTPGITGLLGPNGAGKTTILHLIAGLAQPSEGEVIVLGDSVRDNPGIYRKVGVMTEHESVYGFLSGRRFVEYAARMYALSSDGDAVDRAIDAAGMGAAQYRPINTYSRGMRQRIRLAASIVHDPEVMILDEPLSGTDPRQRIEFQDLLRRLADQHRTILVSSHILEEIETVADRILLMVSGKLAASGDFRAIRAKLDERPYRVRVACSDARGLAALLVGMSAIDSVNIEDDGSLIVLSRNVQALQNAIPTLAQRARIRLERVEPLDESLESVFSYVVER